MTLDVQIYDTLVVIMSERTQGRPFDLDIDEGIESAVTWLLTDKGFENTTVSEVAIEAGTTRAAFYRRYTDLTDLVTRLLIKRFSTELHQEINTGSLPGDLELLQEDQRMFFSDPMVRRSMTGFLGALRSNTKQRDIFWNAFMHPRRQAVAEILKRAARRGEISGEYDANWICDLITGPFFVRVSVPNAGPINRDLVKKTVTAALNDLKYNPL